MPARRQRAAVEGDLGELDAEGIVLAPRHAPHASAHGGMVPRGGAISTAIVARWS
jgi:hypothetical protein